MSEALQHDFLRGHYSTQAGASSQRQLAANTSSFASISVDTTFGMSADIRTPMRYQHADEDFSQPLRELRLNTPRQDQTTVRPATVPEGVTSEIGDPQSAWYIPDMKAAELKADGSIVPDSDPQSAFWIPGLPAGAVTVAPEVSSEISNTEEPIAPPVTTGTPGIKRKLTAVVSGAPAAEFSSGELSPLPPSPKSAAAVQAETTGETSSPKPKGARRARISEGDATPARVSPRLNPGVKKPKTEDQSPTSRTRSQR